MSKSTCKRTYLPFVYILLVVGFLVTTASIAIHYRTSMRIEQQKILELVESQARMVSAVARFDAQYSAEAHPLGAKEATLSQLLDTLSQQSDFTDSGEFLLAHKDKQLNLILDYAPKSITDAEAVASKIIQSISQSYFVTKHPSDREISIGTSIGIAIYPNHSDNADELIKLADIAMYEIKHGAKNNYSIYKSKNTS